MEVNGSKNVGSFNKGMVWDDLKYVFDVCF